MARMAKSFAVVFFLLASTLLYSQDERSHVRISFNDSLGSLARAKTLSQLEKRWTEAPKDYPHRAIHAAMYSKLGGPNPDVVLIDAMPSDGKEMEALYHGQDTQQGQDMTVTKAYDAFYTWLADALGRHPEELPRFLRMIHAFHYVDIVDEWPWLCGLASKIYDTHPDAYISAVSKLEHEFRSEAMDCKQPPDAP
jgi:hypothetical protein